MTGQSLPREGKSYSLCNFLFLSKICFLSHNFGFSYARKPIKGSKDADFSFVSNKTWAKKMAGGVGTQGQVISAKKQKHPLLVTLPTKNPKPKIKKFFLIWTKRLAESFESLNNSLVQLAGILELQSLVKKLPAGGRKPKLHWEETGSSQTWAELTRHGCYFYSLHFPAAFSCISDVMTALAPVAATLLRRSR